MMFVFTEDDPADDLYQKLAKLPGVEMVYEFSGPGIAWECPDYAVIVNLSDINNNEFYAGIEALCPEVVVHPEVILHEQPHIIDVGDIPGPVPTPSPRMRVAQPIIERVPGVEPSNTAVVHTDFSTQAGLSTFAGIGGMQHLATLAD